MASTPRTGRQMMGPPQAAACKMTYKNVSFVAFENTMSRIQACCDCHYSWDQWVPGINAMRKCDAQDQHSAAAHTSMGTLANTNYRKCMRQALDSMHVKWQAASGSSPAGAIMVNNVTVGFQRWQL
jgi:hypothetical protein